MNGLDTEGVGTSSDTMSLLNNGKDGIRSILVNFDEIIFEHDLNPFSKMERSKEFLSKDLITRKLDILKRIGPIETFVVFEYHQSYIYLGPLELYYAYSDYQKKVGHIGLVQVAVLPAGFSRSKVIEAYALLNPDENIPNILFRLKRLKNLSDLGMSNSDIKRFLHVGKSNGAQATKTGRDLKICRNPIVYELVTGIRPDDPPFLPPQVTKSLLPYSIAIQVIDKLGDDIKKYDEYKTSLLSWVNKTKSYELPSDESLPAYERDWYKREKDKPLKLALEIISEKYKGTSTGKLNISNYKPWDISVTDDNLRILRIGSVQLDLKKKSEDNVRLIIDVAYKMDLVSNSLKSYLGHMVPVEHGGSVRGKASVDDKTIELRSNLSEFDGYNYVSFIFKHKAIRYSDYHRFLTSLGVSYSSFGFKNSSGKLKLCEVRRSFLKWDRENSYKFESDYSLFSDLGLVLSRSKIYKIVKVKIKEISPKDEREVEFKDFYLALFVRAFRAWQIIYDAEERTLKQSMVEGEKSKWLRKKITKKPKGVRKRIRPESKEKKQRKKVKRVAKKSKSPVRKRITINPKRRT